LHFSCCSAIAVSENYLVGIWERTFSSAIWWRRSKDESSFTVESKMALSRCNQSI